MEKNEWTNYTFITAWNPKSEIRDTHINKKANIDLLRDLLAIDSYIFPALGDPVNKNWIGEESWLAFNLKIKKARELMIKYDQYAIVYGDRNQEAKLILNEKYLNAKRDILQQVK